MRWGEGEGKGNTYIYMYLSIHESVIYEKVPIGAMLESYVCAVPLLLLLLLLLLLVLVLLLPFAAFDVKSQCLSLSSPLTWIPCLFVSSCLFLCRILSPNRTALCWFSNTITSVVNLCWYFPLRTLPALWCGNVPCLGTPFAFPRPMGYARKHCQGRSRWILLPFCGT